MNNSHGHFVCSKGLSRNQWLEKATITMSMGQVGPFHCSYFSEPCVFKHSFVDERNCKYEIRTFVKR
jgi:hypothetical protein